MKKYYISPEFKLSEVLTAPFAADVSVGGNEFGIDLKDYDDVLDQD